MLMSAVIQPDVFDAAYFSTPGYRDQAEMMFRGIQCNGLLILDPEGRLLRELKARIARLPTKYGQQLQIRLAELEKSGKRRVLVAERGSCNCPESLSLLQASEIVHGALQTDTLIVDSGAISVLEGRGQQPGRITPLGAYISSDFERLRHFLHDELPPIDKMAPGEFDLQMIRLTRFTKRIRIYDKQIGKGSSLGGFRLGIERILSLWARNAHFPLSSLSAEIYTCVQRTHSPTTKVYADICSDLVMRLKQSIRIPITFFFKEDSPALTHDRYLQTDSVAVCFSKGFDYMERNGELHRCSARIDNGAYGHLADYRNLRDHSPPKTF